MTNNSVDKASNENSMKLGEDNKDRVFDTTKLGKQDVDLFFGDIPHSTCDNNIYARDTNGNIYDFDGHRRLIDIEIKSSNYLKQSEYSGDEIRKSVVGKIFSDGYQIYEFFSRDPQSALREADNKINQLMGIGMLQGWISKKGREAMIGQKIYYHDQPAIIVSTIDDQGAIMIKVENGYKAPAWQDWDDDDDEIKDDVLSPHIWWFRG